MYLIVLGIIYKIMFMLNIYPRLGNSIMYSNRG